jgi:hypothetical protein
MASFPRILVFTYKWEIENKAFLKINDKAEVTYAHIILRMSPPFLLFFLRFCNISECPPTD